MDVNESSSEEIQNGATEVVELHLKRGAANGYTPLLKTVDKCYQEIIIILLLKGANENAETATPLSMAVEKGDQEIIRILLSNGANLNAEARLGYTPLLKAVDKGYQEIVKILFSNRADLNAMAVVKG